MPEEKKIDIPPILVKKKKRWLRVLAYLFATFVLLLVGLYFYISSASFIRSQVFSRIESTLNQPVKAAEISFSPFSSIELKDFELGNDPFLKAGRIKVAYELTPMLSNQFNISEVTVEDAAINAIVNRDGKLNILSKIIPEIKDKKPKSPKKTTKGPKQKKETKKKDELVLNIQNINFKNLTIRYFKDDDKQKKQMEVTLKDFSLSLPQLKSGEEFAFEIQAALESKTGTFLLEQGLLKISGKTKLSDILEPEAMSLEVDLMDLQAVNGKVKLPLKAINISSEITFDKDNININKCIIKDPRQGYKSKISLSGNAAPKGNNIDLQIGIHQMDAALLDLAVPFLTANKSFIRYQSALSSASQGKMAGFGTTIVNFSGSVKGSPKKLVSLLGELSINSLPMVRIDLDKSSIVPFNTHLSYDADFNASENIAEINKLDFKVKEDQRQLVTVSLQNPLRIDINNQKITSEKDDELNLLMDKLDINFLKPFMKEEERSLITKGSITIDSKLIIPNKGQSFFVEVENFAVTNAAIKKDDLFLENVSLTLNSRLAISDLKKMTLEKLNLSLLQNNKNNISLKAAGKINLDNMTTAIKVNSLRVFPQIRNFLPENLKEEFNLENINLSSTELKINYAEGAVHARGNIATRQLKLGGTTFPNAFKLSQVTNFDLTYKDGDLTLEEVDLSLSANEQKSLHFNLKGKVAEIDKKVSLNFSQLQVLPGIINFIPAEMVTKLGLANINLNSDNLLCTLSGPEVERKVTLTGEIHSQELALGGEMFSTGVHLSQDMNFDFTLGKNIDLRKLDVLLRSDNKEALNLALSGVLKPDTREMKLDFEKLQIQPAIRKMLPADILKKYKLKNINLLTETLSIDYSKKKVGHIKIKLKTDDLQLGGTMVKPVTLSQTLDIDASIDQNELLSLKHFALSLKPAQITPIEVTAHGKIDLNFKDPKSEIFIVLPQVVDVDALMALINKKTEKKPPSKPSKPSATKGTDTKVETETKRVELAETKKESFKLTVHTSAKGAIVEKTLIENINVRAILDDQKYTLKEASLKVGESLLEASADYLNEETKSFSARLKTNGLFDLAPVNQFLNSGTQKHLGGKVEIQKIMIRAQGKNDDELLKSMLASGKVFMQDLQLKEYTGEMGGLSTALSILGIKPNNMEFHTGEFEFNFEDQLLTLQQCQLAGNAFMLNPTGNIEVTDKAFDVKMSIGVGFIGNKILQKAVNSSLFQAFGNKNKSVQNFQEKYPYSTKYKMFSMKNGIAINKVIPFKSDTENAINFAGLNDFTSQLINITMKQIAGKTIKDEEFNLAVKLLSGDLSGGVSGLLQGVGRSLLERELNKKNKDKNKDKDKKEDLIKGIFSIFGGGDQKKQELKKKKERQENEKLKKEKKKQEKIDKEDELIKGLNDLFK
jgi:hypothetical protein